MFEIFAFFPPSEVSYLVIFLVKCWQTTSALHVSSFEVVAMEGHYYLRSLFHNIGK